MDGYKILIADDDSNICELIRLYLEKAWTVDGDTSVLPDLVKVYFKADPPVYNRKKIHKYMQLCKKHQIPIGDLDDSDDGETADNGTDVGEK